jgi:imidazolonepropionase-like amidohydrolase
VLLAGLVDGSGDRAFGAVTAATPDEGRAVVRRYRDAGFQQIKIYTLVSPETVRAIVAEAHRLGLTVTGHVPAGMTWQSAIEAGFDQLAHMPLRGQAGSAEAAASIAFFRDHRTVIDPTQSWNELLSRSAATPLTALHPDIDRLPPALMRQMMSIASSAGDAASIRARQLESWRLLAQARRAGVAVVAGTDKGVPGFSLPREIELYVEGGMTPLEALQAATIVPARVMNLDGDVGTIEAGKRADLVILTGDPLARISNVRAVRWVVANGRLYDPAPLWRAAGFTPR